MGVVVMVMGGTPPTWWETHDLLTMLKLYEEKRGVVRLVIRDKIRVYINNKPFNEAMDEINRITDVKQLNYLISVGMRGNLYRAVIARQAWLMGIR